MVDGFQVNTTLTNDLEEEADQRACSELKV